MKNLRRVPAWKISAARPTRPWLSHRACLVLALAMLVVGTPGCAYYSFVGAAIPEHLQTIAIPLFDDVSRSGQPGLSEDLVEELIERFVRQTRLSLADDEADSDVVLTGRIESYRNQPAAVSGQERAALNRVTLRVSVRYFDQVENEELLARTFSAFGEYDPVADGFDGETTAATAALESIAGDIFTAATSNW